MNYEPQPGTIPHRAIAWLRSMRRIRPGFEPTTAELCEALDVEVYGFTAYMRPAREQGAVQTRKAPYSKTLLWRIGDGLPDLTQRCPEEEPMHDAIQTLPRRFPADGPPPPSFRVLAVEGNVFAYGHENRDGVSIFTREHIPQLKRVIADLEGAA